MDIKPGIYKLVFNNTPKVYIGQSVDIYSRFIRHKSDMRSGIASNKLLDAYKKFGEPVLEILEESVPLNLLDKLEVKYILEYDAVDNGWNSVYTPCGVQSSSIYGENKPNALYTNEIYEKILNKLAHTSDTVSDIAEELNVSKNVVSQIRQGITHRWLSLEFPELYNLLKDKQNYYKEKGRDIQSMGKSTTLISPSGDAVLVTNTAEFCKKYGLDTGNTCRLINGNIKYLLGWRLVTTPPKQVFKVKSPSGDIFYIEDGSVSVFSSKYGLDNSRMSKLVKNKIKAYRGWTSIEDV